jgi:hypothetical protein
MESRKHAVNAHERLDRARSATREGNYAEALREHLWFHDHALEERPSLSGVRLSYALYDWKELGDVYPEARRVLDESRDRKAVACLSGDGDARTFLDVAAIDDVLGHQSRTHELFVRIDAANPRQAKRFFTVAIRAIVAVGDFDLAIRYVPDPEAPIRRVSDLLNRIAEQDLDQPVALNCWLTILLRNSVQ